MHSKYTKIPCSPKKQHLWPISWGNKANLCGEWINRPGFETLLGQDCRFGRWVTWFGPKKKRWGKRGVIWRNDVFLWWFVVVIKIKNGWLDVNISVAMFEERSDRTLWMIWFLNGLSHKRKRVEWHYVCHIFFVGLLHDGDPLSHTWVTTPSNGFEKAAPILLIFKS